MKAVGSARAHGMRWVDIATMPAGFGTPRGLARAVVLRESTAS